MREQVSTRSGKIENNFVIHPNPSDARIHQSWRCNGVVTTNVTAGVGIRASNGA